MSQPQRDSGELEDADLVNWLVAMRNRQQHSVGDLSECEYADVREALSAFIDGAQCLLDEHREV